MRSQELSEWYFRQLISNPMGGKRSVIAGRTLTDADKKRLEERYPYIYENMRQGLEMDFVCYDDIRKAIDRKPITRK